jgi:hypothetical protein
MSDRIVVLTFYTGPRRGYSAPLSEMSLANSSRRRYGPSLLLQCSPQMEEMERFSAEVIDKA